MKNTATIILLGLIAIVGVFTLDVYLPGMPAMAKEMNVSISQIAHTFTWFLIVFALTQIIHGTLSDYIGRKPVLLAGLFIAAIATIFCIYAKDYETLLLARLAQAVGISSFVVLNAIIRDLYTGSKAIQVRAFVTTISGISISLAPTIGGLLQNRFSWQGGFIASVSLILFVLIVASVFFRESNSNQIKEKFNMKVFSSSYIQIFSDLRYFLYALQATFAYSVHFSFIILSAKIFIDLLGFTPLSFGYLMFVYGGIYFIAGFIAAYLAKRLSINLLIKIGSLLVGISGFAMWILSTIFGMTALNVLIPMSVMTLGITLIRPAATTGALAQIPSQAGQGAAGLNLVQFILSAVIALLISDYSQQPQLSLSLLAIISAILIVSLTNRALWLTNSVRTVTNT